MRHSFLLILIACLGVTAWASPSARPLDSCSVSTLKPLVESAAPSQTAEHPVVTLVRSRENAVMSFLNTKVEGFHSALFCHFFGPTAGLYLSIVPACVVDGLYHVGENLMFPLRAVNCMLQGNGGGAWDETRRFAINTTVGILGWRDAARGQYGIFAHKEDFGQTLAVWGVPSGPYWNVPLLGPLNIRDALALVPDYFLNIASYLGSYSTPIRVNSVLADTPFYYAHFDSTPYTYTLTKVAFAIKRENDIRNGLYAPVESPAPDESFNYMRLQPSSRAFQLRARTRKIQLQGAASPIYYSLWKHGTFDGRIAFILPGIGTHRISAQMCAMAEQFYDAGWTVVIVSSVFSPDYFNGTPQGLPGLGEKEAAVLDCVLRYIRNHVVDELAEDARVHVRGRAVSPKKPFPEEQLHTVVCGFSMGAICTLRLAALDKQGRSILNANRYIAVNPVRNLIAGMKKLDGWFDIPMTWEENQRREHVLSVLLRLANTLSGDGQPLMLTREESLFLLGMNNRLVLYHAFQGLFNANRADVLGDAVDCSSRNALECSSLALSFEAYVRDVLLPYAKKLGLEPSDATLESFGKKQSIDAIADSLAGNEKVWIFHAENDPLLEEGDAAWFKALAGPRGTLFPQGGHMGYLVAPEAKTAILRAAER